MSKFRSLVALCAFAATVIAVPLNLAAQSLIGVDFDNGSGSPLNWTTFRSPAPISGTNLINEAGAATAVDLVLTSTPSGEFASVPVATSVPSHPNPINNVGAYFFGTTTATATFSDLVPSTPYNVWVFGLRAFTMNNRITIAGGGAPITVDQLSVNINELWVNGEVGSSARTLASYAQVQSSTATGQMTLSWLQIPGSTSTGWAIAGVAIQVVPEPTSACVALTAYAFLLTHRNPRRVRG